jgi:hypothetical protein
VLTKELTLRNHEPRRAFEVLGEVRVLAFLRAIRDQKSCVAARLVNEHLDNGEMLREIFVEDAQFGFRLAAEPRGPLLFEVDFGCSPGPFLGDGGEWEVEFDEAGAVVQATATGFWIS